MKLGHLWWTAHAQERLQERFGMTPADVVAAVDERTLAMAAGGASAIRIPSLDMILMLNASAHHASVLTAIKARGAKRWD